MKILLVTLLLGVGTAAPNWDVDVGTFFSNSHPAADSFFPENTEHARVKRAAYGMQNPCTAGWSGQFCENPICANKSTISHDQNTDKLVELIYAPSGCTGTYYVPVDSTCGYLHVQVTTNGPVPYITLTSSNGTEIQTDKVYNSTGSSFSFYEGIAPDEYSVTVTTNGMATTLCAMEFSVKSTLEFGHGFVDIPQSDFPPHGSSAAANRMQNLAIYTYHPTVKTSVNAVSIYQRTDTFNPIMRSTLTQRYGCSYEQYVGGKFTCSSDAVYTVTVDGVDANGMRFRRTKSGWGCVTEPTTPVVPTVPIDLSCLNGGTLLYAGTPQAQCLCTELFTGSTCATPNCMNGGFLAPSGVSCDCQSGYIGINCQNVVCASNAGSFLTEAKTLIVVWRSVRSMSQYVSSAITMIKQEMTYLSQTAGLEPYRNYLLITYHNDGYDSMTYTTAQYDNFLNDLSSLNQSTVTGNCTDVGMAAIMEVFRRTVYSKSAIYIFTDAPASDYGHLQSVIDTNAFENLPIYTFFHNTTAAQSCKIDEISAGYRAFETLAFMSGALVFTPSDANYLTTISLAVRATSYKMNPVLVDDVTQCNIDGYRTFFADSATTSIAILATGENLLFAITLPNGTVTSPQIFNDGRNYFYTIPQSSIIRGEYLLQFVGFDTQYPCSYRVLVQSDYDLFLAVTNFVGNDNIFAEPIYQQSNAIVAQVNGMKVTDQFRLFSEVMIVSNDGSYHEALYFSNGIYRTGCSYHLFFGYTNFCKSAGQVFYATVYVDDPQGYTIQRTSVGYCAGQPPTQSPPTSCVNGGIPDPNNSTRCLCPPLYSGQFCSDYNCQNGGFLQNGICKCPVGLGGTFCEEQRCLSTNTNTKFTSDGQSLTFVISTYQTMNATWQALASNAQRFVNNAQLRSPTWITKYALVLINSAGVVHITETSRASNFVNAIQNFANNFSTIIDTNPNCTIKLESGLSAAVQLSNDRSSIYAFFDSVDATESGIITLQILAGIEARQLQVNFIVTTAGALCGSPTGWLDDAISTISIYSGGWMYATTNIPSMLDLILSEYNNGIVLDYSVADCTQPQTFYLPVDSASQSLTIVANGANASISLWLPDQSSAKDGQYEIELVKESNMVIDQYMIACPNNQWQYYQHDCLNFIGTPTAYSYASNNCHNMGGWPVEIFNQDKQTYIHAQTVGVDNWIGLTMLTAGNWYWDIADQNQATPLTDLSYNNWIDKITPNDTTKRCAYMDKDGFWIAADCSNSYYYICQRHRFGQEVIPNDPTTNLLPAGFWKLQVQTSSGMCAVQARVQSTIQLYFGYVQDSHSDFAENYGNSNASNNYVVVGATGLNMFDDDRHPSNEGRLNYVYMGKNFTAFNALAFDDRASCSYRYISQNFSCKTQGVSYEQFFVRFSGIDPYGYTFERIASTYCGTYGRNCLNGGFVYQGLCVCPESYIGNNCEIPVCLNGGMANSDNKCVCTGPFTGVHCEIAECEPPYPIQYSDTKRTLAIALETSILMSSTIAFLKKNIVNIIANITTNGTGVPEWWDSYILYPFDSTINKAYWYSPVYSNNFTDLLVALNKIGRGCPNNTCDQTNCPRPYYRILADMMSNNIFASPNSDILVITQSSPEDYSLWSDVAVTLQNSRARLYFLISGSWSPCGEGWTTQAVQTMRTLAEYSQGGIYVVSPIELVNNWLGQYFPATYRSGVVIGGGVSENCSSMEWIFPIENSATHLLLEYFGSAGALTLIAPDGTVQSLPASLTTAEQIYLGVFPLALNGATMAGNWILRIVDPGTPMCDLRIRLRSNIELYAAFTQPQDQYGGATNDNGHFQPLIGSDNIVLAHENVIGDIATIDYAQIIVVRNNVGFLYFTSEMRRRSRTCGYEYYSTQSFQCHMENFFVIIYGRDIRGATFNRAFVSHCITDRPMPPPPAPWCDLTTTKTDFVFMIDGSTSASNVLGVFKLFINKVLGGYTIGPNATQAGGFTFADATPGGGAFQLNAASDYATVSTNIFALQLLSTTGANVTQAIQYITSNYNDPSNGYRVDTSVKHVVVYITANPQYTDTADPIAAVQSLRRSGAFGFVVITEHITETPDWIRSLTGTDCSYYATDDNDLAVNAVNFLTSLSCFRNSPCGM